MKYRVVVLALVLAAGACAPRSHNNYVVLLNNPGGGSGKVIVSNQKGRHVLNQCGGATSISAAGKAPSSTWQLGRSTLQQDFGRALAARPQRFARYTIYFDYDKANVDPSSEETYRKMLDEVARRKAVDATVAGHADRTGGEDHNQKLSEMRAKKIRDDLVRVGVPIDHIEVDFFGDTEPAVPTPENMPELRNRRVEVMIR